MMVVVANPCPSTSSFQGQHCHKAPVVVVGKDALAIFIWNVGMEVGPDLLASFFAAAAEETRWARPETVAKNGLSSGSSRYGGGGKKCTTSWDSFRFF